MIEMIVRDLMGTVHQLIITCKSSYCVRSWTTSCPTKLQTGKVPKGGQVEKKNPKFPGFFFFQNLLFHEDPTVFPTVFKMKISNQSYQQTTKKPSASAETSRSCYRSNAHAFGRRSVFF